MIYSDRLKTATTLDTTLITLAQAKNYLRVTTSDATEDTKITNQLMASRGMIEERLNRIVLTQTRTHRIDSFPVGNIQLWQSPIQSITSVKHYDSDDSQQTLVVDTDYRVDIYTGRIEEILGWPATYNKVSAVEVEYIAGYTVANVPPGIRNGILYQLWESYHGDPMDKLIEASVGFYKNQVF